MKIKNDFFKIFPEPLRPGDQAALIALSSPLSDDALEDAVHSLEFLGLKPVIMPSCKCAPPRPWLAASDEQRAADLTSALADQQIRGIFFARGGYGCARVAPLLDFSLFKRFPKLLLGSSDLTFLLNAVSRKSGLVTFHGPMPTAGYKKLDKMSLSTLRTAIFGSEDITYTDDLRGGRACPVIPISIPFEYDRIIGGNLTVLCSMLTTPYEPDFTNAAVFLEDINEPLYKIDRMLATLTISGRLSRCAGLVFGSFKNCCKTASEKSLLLEIQQEAGRLSGVPVVSDQPFGHDIPSFTFPIG